MESDHIDCMATYIQSSAWSAASAGSDTMEMEVITVTDAEEVEDEMHELQNRCVEYLRGLQDRSTWFNGKLSW